MTKMPAVISTRSSVAQSVCPPHTATHIVLILLYPRKEIGSDVGRGLSTFCVLTFATSHCSGVYEGEGICRIELAGVVFHVSYISTELFVAPFGAGLWSMVLPAGLVSCCLGPVCLDLIVISIHILDKRFLSLATSVEWLAGSDL